MPRWLRAFFSPHSSGFPLRQLAQSSPFAGGARLLLARRPGLALCRVAPGSPLARGLEIALCRVARGFPRTGWLGVSSSPVAPDSSLPEGPDLPFAVWLGVSPLPVARGFPFAGYRPGGRRISTPIGGTAQGVSSSNLKILLPSTSHPQLAPSCPPRRDFLHRTLHRMIHRAGCVPGEGPISQARGSGRRI